MKFFINILQTSSNAFIIIIDRICVVISMPTTLAYASRLKIDGLNLNQSFKTGRYEYTVELKEDKSSFIHSTFL